MDTKAKAGLAALIIGGASALYVAGHKSGDWLDSMPVIGNTIEVGESTYTVKDIELPREKDTLIQFGSKLCGYDSTNSAYMQLNSEDPFTIKMGPDYSLTGTPSYDAEKKCFE